MKYYSFSAPRPITRSSLDCGTKNEARYMEPLKFNVATQDPQSSGTYYLSCREGYQYAHHGELFTVLKAFFQQYGHRLLGLRGVIALTLPLPSGGESTYIVERRAGTILGESVISLKTSRSTARIGSKFISELADHSVFFDKKGMMEICPVAKVVA